MVRGHVAGGRAGPGRAGLGNHTVVGRYGTPQYSARQQPRTCRSLLQAAAGFCQRCTQVRLSLDGGGQSLCALPAGGNRKQQSRVREAKAQGVECMNQLN